MTGIIGNEPSRSTGFVGAFTSTGIDDNADANAVTIASDESVTLSGDLVPSTPLSSRNMIINGGMGISQRGTSVTVSNGSNEGYSTLDRFSLTFGSSLAGSVTYSQDSDAPDGFGNSLKIQCASTDTPTGSESLYVLTKLEGQDLQRLCYGSSGAKTVILSFYAKRAGTDWGNISIQANKVDGTEEWFVAGATTLTTSWARYSITIPANTANTIANNNSASLIIRFSLSGISGGTYAGATDTAWGGSRKDYNTAIGNLLSDTSNIFYLTGVQLELGGNATPFEHRSYADELAKCQRYCWTTGDSGYGSQGVVSALTSDSYHRSRFWSPQTCRHKTQALTATVTDWGATSGNSTFAFHTSLTITSGGAGLNSQDVSGRLDAGSGGHSVLWPLNETDGTSPLIFDCEL